MSRMGDSTELGQGNEGQSAKAAVAEKAAQVGQNLKDLGQQAKDAATQQYEQIRGQAEEYYEHGKERVQEWEQSLESFVKEKPVQSLLIAAGVGVAIGLLLRR